MGNQLNLKRAAGILAIATVIALIAHLALLHTFNQRVLEVHGSDKSSATYMDIDSRKDSTSTWVKRDYDLNGEKVDLIGATIDGTLYNGSQDTVQEWTLKINITQDCFINQAWNGEVEVHQFVGTDKETVQRLNLQDYDLEKVELENKYDGDMLIPLQAGDYVLYFPSTKFKEEPLAGGDNIMIGVIFYYLDSLDLSNYDLEFQYHRTFVQGPLFPLFVLLAGLCFVFALMYKVSDITYRRAKKDMELQKSGILSMADMYEAIYIVDLASGVTTPVSTDDKAERERPWKNGAASFFRMITADAEDAYRDIVREFFDLDTLAQRLNERDSIVCEFRSKSYGWSSMRFFAMDRAEGELPEKAIFTAQDINDEKAELDRVESRIRKAESSYRTTSAFVLNMSEDMQAPLQSMVEAGERIRAESPDERIRAYAAGICSLGDDLLAFTSNLKDYSKLGTGDIALRHERYSLKGLVCEIVGEHRAHLRQCEVDLTVNVSETLPDGLKGDSGRIKQVMGILVSEGAEAVGPGAMTLSVFGKVLEGKVHLLMSVRAVGRNAADGAPTQSGVQRVWTTEGEEGTSADVAMELASGLIDLMGSNLKVVHSSDMWNECYFEVEQDIVDATPVGRLDLDGATGGAR